jgi:hypothetical protein
MYLLRYGSLLLLFILFHAPLHACDACGCSILFLDMGITPRFQQHQLGLQWHHQTYRSYANTADREGGVLGSEEQLHFLSLQGQWQLRPRWRLTAQLPYVLLERQVGAVRRSQQGLGDVSMLLQFVAINQDKKSSRELRHRLSLGLGTKAPSGHYRQSGEESDPTLNPNFRLGSGSWDLLLSSQYVLRYRRWGSSVDLLHSRNGTNSEDYQFGHRWLGNVQLFGVFSKGKLGFMPQLGWSFEQGAQDVERGFYRNVTGGYYHFLRQGLQVFLPRFSVQLQHQLPLQQNWAQGLTEARSRWTVQWNYFW